MNVLPPRQKITLAFVSGLFFSCWPTQFVVAQSPVRITFNNQVGEIIYSRCSHCHHSGQGAPFNFTNYEEVKKRAKLIAAVTRRRVMPPWHAVPADIEFHGERRLSDADIDTIQKWVSEGAPKGTAPSPKLPEFNDGWLRGKPDLVLTMPEPFVVPADGPDIYRSFAIPLPINEDTWVEAIEFRALRRAVVHHCFFFLDTSGKSHRNQLDDGQPGFRNMPTESWQNSLGGWNFGGDPVSVPEGMAYRLPKGADFILQTHFHPTGKEEREVSSVGIYFAKRRPSRVFTSVMLPPVFGALVGIDIPPGSDDTMVEDTFELPVDVDAFGITAHAHYLGKEVEMTAELPNGNKITLLKIDDWDFGWQEQYTFKKFRRLPRGAKLHAAVRYDNTAENPVNPSTPPKRVRWGRSSDDEMGAITLSVSPKNQEDLDILNKAYRFHLDNQMLDRALGDNTKPSFIRNTFKRMDRNKNGIFEPEERELIMRFLKGNGLWPKVPGFNPNAK